MDQCKREGCWSYAINDHKESGLCDKCYWIEQAEKLTAERDKLKYALHLLYSWANNWDSEFMNDPEWKNKDVLIIQEALKESA